MRLLLLSNSTNPGEGYLEYPQDDIRDFLGQKIREVLFIPFAGVAMGYDAYTEKTAAAFNEMGYRLKGIHKERDMHAAVRQAEAIAVGGGNTFHLLSEIYRHGLKEIIREEVDSGMPYMGWSAGSNVACPTIRTTNDMPIVEPPSFVALQLIPFQINPHYTEATIPHHGGESRKQRILEFIEVNPEMPVVCIPEGSLLRLDQGQLNYKGGNPGKIFLKGSDEQGFSDQQDLSRLLG